MRCAPQRAIRPETRAGEKKEVRGTAAPAERGWLESWVAGAEAAEDAEASR